jgi:GNAT superfamily N-acetyltransferase
MPEGVSELRWLWIRARHPNEDRFFLYYPNSGLADHRVLRVCDRNGLDHASLVWNICHECRRGVIAKISMIPEWQRQGLGRRLVRWALHQESGYDWVTSSQSPDGQQFFPALARETGAALTNRGKACGHINAAGWSFPRPRLVHDV